MALASCWSAGRIVDTQPIGVERAVMSASAIKTWATTPAGGLRIS